MRPLRQSLPTATHARPPDVHAVHAQYADFLWATLERLGIPADDLEDLCQEVYIVVHRKLHTFDGSSKFTTWLFGICLRVAIGWRRPAFRRREQRVAQVPDEWMVHPTTPEDHVSEHELRTQLQQVLELMDPEKRAVFLMFEIDQMSCGDIAELMGIPLGTVYSRLHTARKIFATEYTRLSSSSHGAKP